MQILEQHICVDTAKAVAEAGTRLAAKYSMTAMTAASLEARIKTSTVKDTADMIRSAEEKLEAYIQASTNNDTLVMIAAAAAAEAKMEDRIKATMEKDTATRISAAMAQLGQQYYMTDKTTAAESKLQKSIDSHPVNATSKLGNKATNIMEAKIKQAEDQMAGH